MVASDAHRTEELGQLDYAVSMARRAWLTADDVANTRDAATLLEILSGSDPRDSTSVPRPVH